MNASEFLGSRMAELRRKRNMTQAKLASIVKKSTSAVAMWETGKRDPDSQMIIELSSIFDVPTDYLLGRTNDPDDRLKYSARNENYRKIERFARKVSNEDLEKAVKILEAAFEHAFNDDDDI
ncbi:HTH-type transcriptional regulator ImmR [Paenibacillus larvae subsp. larvae]|uniref:HTH-type transcriptional regulator ImmR n=1 Tax=Paenibacillus larvae subsp. larvae TaxID=147375 RepID=A0A2L1UH49_9BACL|nr:helix-turn-helix transcriptional regulator [Paenibacillus larvae]AQT84119.1 hypothetical protein B1222_06530 [Paenibacillus larvae subsp. pulvifaciens]AQZ46097.1 hypothetical protein B5S25_05185 [Paenibacillus larvae subsp. pulvifaciens]AVF27750.1 HTH-type transcriptional regulator ImmR [Paenibacillus larvae subsp. larvae]AVF32253.1 HTH-type transcriptional regulator ImmR [Paenibacillus larvae subsp. larvae]MCY7521954.1 helix-turn-helix domain-containing protein [Paenibacillus larvae]